MAPPLPPEVFAPGYGTTGSGGAAADAGLGIVVPLTRPANGSRVPPHASPLSAPPPVRGPSSPSASSQPLPPPGGWPDVDPSVYEDETVAMTASELEAAADAKGSLPPAAPAPLPFRSQPPPKPWLGSPASAPPSSPRAPGAPMAVGLPAHAPNATRSPETRSSVGPQAAPGYAPSGHVPTGHVPAFAPAAHATPFGIGAHGSSGQRLSGQGLSGQGSPAGHPSQLAHLQVPPATPMFPQVPAPVSSNPLLYPNSDVPSSGVSAVGPHTYQPPSPAFPAPTRAESWAIGRQPAPSNSFGERLSPAPPSARTWTSVEPHVSPRREHRWVFPLLLVTLGVGGLVLGGVLGKTWIAHVINPGQTPVTVSAATPPSDANLAPFAPLDANSAIEAAQRDAIHCLSAEAAPLSGLLLARFTPAGNLDQLQLSGSLGTAPETPCVRSIFEKVRVAPFSGPPAQVEKAIELRPQP